MTDAVIFDFSGTLFRLDEDDSWFDGVTRDDGSPLDGHHVAELMRRMTAPVGEVVEFDDVTRHAWQNRDLDPALHRQAYLHVLHQSGVIGVGQAESVYGRVVDPSCWTPYPDTADVLKSLASASVPVAVLSNIAFDIRPAFEALGIDRFVTEFVLSYEIGVVKPNPEIFLHATQKLGIDPSRTLMVGDSEEADGAATAIGCSFALVEPLPTADRPTALRDALARHGL
ncbi:HAD family hydrolase [Rhodococcoides kyotonense]|uniref:Haloacid dehalogenase n=1 Tax=Rhodococcoides kyotonense TaxID=398843 RepID=A0A239CVT6_9NOCA|nr:HAD family hydrolase [Rhodococcus kyotonensis]SNS24356.1 Haloacid dehalogenase superfamily, subfamily IA, variant 2 with 3rd motif like haloacid dehalogenase/haloacid dehalogenase superfamily, subfamily IA, variant 3 with third motif having DD or ED/haloacid dehalogenase superfamily, subfamily IA, variant 1 with third motif having Dx(3-4)D or Dx(3-4)E [Rhodococcus kyotonensis]